MAAQMAVNSGASLWGPPKELWEMVEGAMWRKEEESVHLLDRQLKKHRSHFVSLYRNPPKSAEQREKLRKASTEGIAIQGQRGSQLLPEELVAESLILSDLFDTGEVSALELLLAGEHLQPHFPGLTRGLVAVQLYWDGKQSVANSLRSLIQCRHSKIFHLELSGELVALATLFTDELMSQGHLTRRILDLVSTIDVQREFKRLQKCRGLGNEKHRREVSDLITECREALAGCLFSWTCQSPLAEDDTLVLIGHLETVTAEADGSLDSVNLALVMALLYCLDVSFLKQGTEDGDLLRAMPFLTDRHYVSAVHRRLMDRRPWTLPGLQAVCRLAWALTLRALSQLPQGSALVEFTKEDEALAEKALHADVFLFLKEGILGCKGFAKELLYLVGFHSLLTDFLALMPMKVKELRDCAEEDARLVHMSLKTGSEPPSSLKKDLDHFMTLIGEFYSKDPFSLELALGFWSPTDPVQHTSPHSSYLGMTLQRPPHKLVLSKFVRQMGDLLPSTLYIAYLRMLKGLANGPQCAYYCFNLLKTNGAPYGAKLQGVAGNPASWEHFFHALMLYHDNLKRDRLNPDTPQYQHCPLKVINQRELDGITSFMELFTTIITWSEDARLALWEHPQWTPVVVILGLLQCSIPSVLKVELLRCLSAFGKSPEIAASLWQSLEYTQILQTVKLPGQQRQTAGIELELNEVESNCKEYPMTRAFCQLISTLVESGVPTNLGAGLRVPGFQPYLAFLQDSVFLPFPTRAYRRPAEKWEVVDAVLEVFHKLLQDYEPKSSDFVQETVELQGKQLPAHKPPGHSIMFHLLTNSPMLALCLSLLEEGIHQLDTYAPFHGQKQLESAVLHCLCLLDLALQKEVVFMDLLRESEASLLVSPLEQLLHEVNCPKSRRADHVVNIARYLSHNSSNPEAAFQSAKILRCIARYPNIQMRLVGDFTNDQAVSDKLMTGFIDCLDNVDAEEGIETVDDSDPLKKVAKIRHETQVHILNLLITSLELKAPNLSFYLLGYEVKNPVSTNLQDPGVLGFPRSCLHAILNMLQRGSDKRSGPVLTGQAPHLAELCYKVIYQLCACSETSGPTMRYLRTSHDFLFSQLQHLPFVLPGDQISTLYQMSWLMKTAAIELRVTSLNRQRFHVQRLANLLLDDQPYTQHAADGSGIEEETRSMSGILDFDTVPKVRRKLLSLLDTINFSQDIPELPQLGFFEPTQLEQVISNCDHVNEQGQTVCNVKLLHRVLVAEVNALQGMAAIGQRSLLMREVNSILEQVVERNCVRRTLSAKHHLLQSWRILVETLLTACPADLVPAEDRQLIIRDLLLDLLDKVLSEDATEELMPNVAEAVFTLTSHLGLSLLSEHQQGVGPEVGVSFGFSSIANSALHLILRKLLDFILRTGGRSQRMRIHLYGSLLNVLKITHKPDEPDMLQSGNAMWERLTTPEDDFSKLQRENLAIIESYGTALMEVVCRDACDGHKSGRMLALEVMDRILSNDQDRIRLDSILSSQWLVYMCKSGCLRVLVESLKQDDVALQSLLITQPPVLEPLYMYESKMTLLTRVAKTGIQGAMELLQCGLVSQLIECQVFDMIPRCDSHRTTRDPSGLIPSPLDRYRQILLPTLNLLQVILISTSTHHQQGAAHSTSIHHPQGAAQVLTWLVVNADTIQSLLLCQDLNMETLQLLCLLTGIISKTALPGVLNRCGEINSDVLKRHIKRFQHLCLSLLGRLAGSEREKLLKHAEMDAPGDPADCREEMEVVMQQVCANIMEYCHSLLLQSSAQAQFSICLFGPSSSRPGDRDLTHDPSLGLVLYLLKNRAADFFRFQQSHKQSVGKLQSLDQLPPEELKEQYQGLVSVPGGVEKISPVQRSLLAKRRLVQLINNRAKLLALCSYVIETCLFVLWRHLEYYLLYCTPTDPKDSLLPGVSGIRLRLGADLFGGLRGTEGRVLGQSRVSQQDLDQLRTDMAAGFGEALQRKLLEVEGSYSQVRSRYPIIQALICKIHRLLHQPKSSTGYTHMNHGSSKSCEDSKKTLI